MCRSNLNFYSIILMLLIKRRKKKKPTKFLLKVEVACLLKNILTKWKGVTKYNYKADYE